MTDLSPAAQTDTDPRDLIERMCACLHGWSVLWGPAANSPTSLLVDEARRYLAQSEPEPLSLKRRALGALSRADKDALTNPLTGEVVALRTILSRDQVDTIRRALEQLDD